METSAEGPISIAAAPDFGEIVTRYYGSVYRRILGLVRDAAEAQGLTQETFLKVHQGFPGFRGHSSLGTWIHRIARNVVADWHRRRACRPDSRTVALEAAAEGARGDAIPTPAQAAERRLSDACVQQCVALLPEPYRDVVRLRELLGLGTPEIAERLGVSVEAAKMRVHRAREQLRATFDASCEVYRDQRNELACQPRARGC